MAAFWRFPYERYYLYAVLYTHLVAANALLLAVLAGYTHRYSSIAPSASASPKASATGATGSARMWQRIKKAYAEEHGFRYHPLVVAILVAAAHVTVFSTVAAISRVVSLSKCMSDVDNCNLRQQPNVLFFIPAQTVADAFQPEGTVFELQASAAAAFNLRMSVEEADDSLAAPLRQLCTEGLRDVVAQQLQGGSPLQQEMQALVKLCSADVDETFGAVTQAFGGLLAQQDVSSSSAEVITTVMEGGPADLARLQSRMERALEAAELATEQGKRGLAELALGFGGSGVVGYLIGSMLAIWSLLDTLGGYKRFSKLWRKHQALARLVGPDHAAEIMGVQDPARHAAVALADLKAVSIVYSVFFMGMVVSTAFIQIHIFGALITCIGMLLCYPPWWHAALHVATTFRGAIIASVLIVVVNYGVILWLLSRSVVGRSHVKSHKGWVM